MKGLLLKDFYMMMKYCRTYFFISVIFCGLSLTESSNLFMAFYPCMLCGMIPVNLLAYDERSRWLQYSETMPYTRAQIVSGKYIIGLCTQLTVLIITGILQAVRMSSGGGFRLGEYAVLMLLLFTMSLLSTSISLPFIFKLGVEKGRMAYYIMVGIVCAGSVISSNFVLNGIQPGGNANVVILLICLIGIGIYVLSWYMSVVFYRKREL